ncbi:hypothetical protein IscW_ISCW000075, partial [Ixodes scapularis]
LHQNIRRLLTLLCPGKNVRRRRDHSSHYELGARTLRVSGLSLPPLRRHVRMALRAPLRDSNPPPLFSPSDA